MALMWLTVGLITGLSVFAGVELNKRFDINWLGWSGLVLGEFLVLFCIAWSVASVLEAQARITVVAWICLGSPAANTTSRATLGAATVGTTALVVTKLDEAAGLGNLLPLARECRLPLSYLTDGQNVPDDICVAERRDLAKMILGMS